MLDDETNDSVNNYLKKQSKRFSFLVDPDSYLLAASVASGIFSVPFVILNIIALECLSQNCPALHNGSNTLTGWIIFEAITLSFISISYVTGATYLKAKKQKRG